MTSLKTPDSPEVSHTKDPLTQDEIQILDSALLGTEFTRRINEIVVLMNNLEGIDMVHAMLAESGSTIPQWGAKKRLIQFFVSSLLRKVS